MAEAMCGPSNALQQFKQQTSLDRSLQQDRFTNRRQPSQGFRSANPNAGLLDPEFEAFQAGRSTTPVLEHLQTFQAPARFGSPSQAAPSWADDFQRMSISPVSQMQQQPQVFPASPSAANWASGFRDQFKQAGPRASSPSPLAFQQMARYGQPSFQSSFVQPAFVPEVQSAKGKAPATDAFDEAAFERAFDMAREDMIADAVAPAQDVVAETKTDTMDTTATETQLDVPGTGIYDQFHRPDALDSFDFESFLNAEEQQLPVTEQPIEPLQNDDDALAATAQELLEKVEHNQSDKFKNSQFLGLMRKLADRQVRVEGDKMVETADAAAAAPPMSSGGNPSLLSPNPPARLADTRLGNVNRGIPAHEQDHDPGRIDPRDGRDVTNLLNDPGLAEEIGPYLPPRTGTHDVGMYSSAQVPAQPPGQGTASFQNTSLTSMLYGPQGTLSQR